MPTGYTQKILDGEVKTAKDFLHLCLRDFGVLYCLRDEPMRLKDDYSEDIIKDGEKTAGYYKEMLQLSKKTLAEVQLMSDDELYERYLKEYQNMKSWMETKLTGSKKNNEVYNSFIEKIQSWECSAEYESIKSFAIDQLTKSKEVLDYYEEKLSEVGDLSRENFELKKESYKANLIKGLQWDIDYFSTELEKAENRMNERLTFYKNFKNELEKLK